ncbi:MAG: HD domain-containing protein [Pyrinomonadaceae bacterium]|nr:HD domain-containing protein [Pyrinomonadaceae bacterium]
MKSDLEKSFEFIIELEKLKSIDRKIKPVGLDRYENSAEHSWHIAIVALALGDFSNEKIDISRVVKMLLVHDIGEIDAGDVIFFDDNGKEEAKSKELESVNRIFGILPEEKRQEFFDLWDEFENGGSAEAKYARAIDRVMPILQNVNNNGQSWQENGIDKEQVLSKTAYIADGSEVLWESISKKIEVAFEEL